MLQANTRTSLQGPNNVKQQQQQEKKNNNRIDSIFQLSSLP